ncbi:MAG: ATP-binding cassette domain-containing protein [Gemmatimonadota bacterium]|nr:ATP-binding cassette domain-containing protein [Gemmatimonadota bacterium]
MIKVSDLTKRYGNFLAVDKISFQLKKGEILGFLGPNGAGKTTVMRIITGFLSATRGDVSVSGHDVFLEPLEVKRNIGYLPELPPLYHEMRVADYLEFCGRIKGLKGARTLKKRLDYVIECCALGEMRSRHIHKLSKGYRQRVGLAQALIHDPPILILDEPSSGLDPHQIIEVRQLIRSLAGKHSILLSTHILPEASRTCDRVLIIDRGKILAEDTTEQLTGKLTGGERLSLMVRNAPDGFRKLLSGVPGAAGVETTAGGPGDSGTRRFDIDCKPEADIRSDLARTVVESGADLLELKSQAMTLEEIFIQITSRDQEQ